MLYAIKFSLV